MTRDTARLEAVLSEFLPVSDIATAVALARRTARLMVETPAEVVARAAPASPRSSGLTAGVPVHGSQLGGLPRLPADVPWPVDADGPLSLLAQLDLAEVRAAGTDEVLPATGLLTVFGRLAATGGPRPVTLPGARTSSAEGPAVPEGPEWPEWPPAEAGTVADPDSWRVVVADTATSVLAATPGEVVVAPYLPVRVVPAWSLPSLADDLVLPRDDDHWTAAVQALDLAPRHRVGGWPTVVDGAVHSVFEAAGGGGAERFRLLVQLDDDDRLGWRSPGGPVAVCLHEDDLRAQEWGRAHCVVLDGHTAG